MCLVVTTGDLVNFSVVVVGAAVFVLVVVTVVVVAGPTVGILAISTEKEPHLHSRWKIKITQVQLISNFGTVKRLKQYNIIC